MAKLRKNGIAGLKTVVEKLQRSFSLGKKPASDQLYDDDHEDQVSGDDQYSGHVPADVKEGHFAVIAVDGQGTGTKRFVVPLFFLNHPPFLRLLERAAEEYGFDHEGALTIPCRPSELERILHAHPTTTAINGGAQHDYSWGSSSKTSFVINSSREYK